MRAARLHAYGSAASLRYEDAPDPRPGPGELLIRVHAAGVTPTELAWVPTSTTRDGAPRPLPLILGHELSGVVAAVGAGVTGFRVGEAVYGMNDWFGDGASAEYCTTKESEIATKPTSLDHLQAAVVPISGLTAWQGLFQRAHLQAGERVLIHGGAGAVGVFAIQLARRHGARVIATASGQNLDFVRDLGADEVIDYRAQRFEDVVRDVDVVFDGVGGDTLARSRAVVRPGGRLVTIAASSRGTPDQETKDAFFLVEANGQQLRELARLIDAGEVRPVVDRVFPLAQARAAYEYHPQRGKAVVAVA